MKNDIVPKIILTFLGGWKGSTPALALSQRE